MEFIKNKTLEKLKYNLVRNNLVTYENIEKAEELAETVWMELYFSTSNREMLNSIAKGLETLCEQDNYDSAFNMIMAYKEVAMLYVKDIYDVCSNYILKSVFVEIFVGISDEFIDFICDEYGNHEEDNYEELPFA